MESEYDPIGTRSRLLAHVPASRREESNVCAPSDIVEWPGNELIGRPTPPAPNPWHQRSVCAGAKHTPQTPPAMEPARLMATAHPGRRCQHNDTEIDSRSSASYGTSSIDSAAIYRSQQSDQSNMDTAEHIAEREEPRKRKRPGPVPKLEHMTLQDLQHGDYFDMQIEDAAAKLGVGRTVLTRRVRQLGIQRWPYRRRASMRNLILKTHLYLSWQSAAQHPAEAPSTESIVDMLHREMDPCKMHKSELLEDAIMRYRQTFFKQEHIAKKTGITTTNHHA